MALIFNLRDFTLWFLTTIQAGTILFLPPSPIALYKHWKSIKSDVINYLAAEIINYFNFSNRTKSFSLMCC